MIKDEWCGLSAHPWCFFVPPLSLDLMTEFYVDAGLFFLEARALQLILRQTILENREVFTGWMSGIPDSAMLGAVRKIGPELQRRSGYETAALFRTWCTEVFTIEPLDSPHW